MTLAPVLDGLPILLLIALGALLRATRLVDRAGGLVLTRLAFYVTIPAAIYSSIARARLTAGMLLLPVISLVLPVLLAAIAYLTTRHLAEKRATRGTMVASMVVLGVFGYPFFELFYGAEGLARMVIYDVGNAIYAGTVALWLAQRFGRCDDGQRLAPWRRVLASPIMWAAVLGVVSSLVGFAPPPIAADLLERLTAANTPLAMIAVGVFVTPRAVQARLLAHFVAVRMVLGALLGWGLAVVLGLGGLDVVTAGAASALPVGTTALIYAGAEGLDAELAAAIISVTVILGSVAINVLPHLLAALYL